MRGKLKQISCILVTCLPSLALGFILTACTNESQLSVTSPHATPVTIPAKKVISTPEAKKQKVVSPQSKATPPQKSAAVLHKPTNPTQHPIHPTAEQNKTREHKLAKLNGQKTPNSRVLAAGGYISGAIGGS